MARKKTDNQQHPCLVISRRLLLFLLLPQLFQTNTNTYTTLADVGTAAQYDPPYSPTACYGNDPSQFPSSNLFAAAGDGIWDNGASCGRHYLVRCITASVQGTCILGQTIEIVILDFYADRGLHPGNTILLSNTAFGSIANSSFTNSIGIEFLQV